MARAKATATKRNTKTASKTPVTKSTAKKSSSDIRVKSSKDVVSTVNRLLSHNLHDRFKFGFSKSTKVKLTAYGPWLAAVSVIVISPELMSLAKNGRLLTITSFFNEIFFNQQAWLILVIILVNILLLVDGLTDLFDMRLRGWNRVYAPALITGLYVLWQLMTNLDQPAAPLLSLLGAWFVLFSLLEIKSFYKK